MTNAAVDKRTVVKLLAQSQRRDRGAGVLELQGAERIGYQHKAVALHGDHVLGPQQARGLREGRVGRRSRSARRAQAVPVRLIDDPAAQIASNAVKD